MSCVIAVFNDELGILASDGRASSVDAQGKIVIAAEDAYKHLQLDRTIAVATAGVGACAVPVLRMLRDVHWAFRGRSKDLLGGLEEFVKLIPKPRKGDFADAPVPLAIVFLAADPKTGNVQLTLVHGANDYQGQTFQCSPGGPPQMVILSPCDETTNFIYRRLNDVLPQIFKKRGQSLVREAKAAIWLAIADASKNDQRINAQVGFATVCRTENSDGAEVPGPTVAMDSPRSCLRIVGDSIHRVLRFYVGSIFTPADGHVDTVGNNDGGTGAQIGYQVGMRSTIFDDVGTTPVTNPERAMDSDDGTYALLGSPGKGIWRVFGSLQLTAVKAAVLKIKTEIVSGGGTAILEYSLDNGANWTIVFYQGGNRGPTTDSVNLPVGQAMGIIQVRATTIGTQSLKVYDARIEFTG